MGNTPLQALWNPKNRQMIVLLRNIVFVSWVGRATYIIHINDTKADSDLSSSGWCDYLHQPDGLKNMKNYKPDYNQTAIITFFFTTLYKEL